MNNEREIKFRAWDKDKEEMLTPDMSEWCINFENGGIDVLESNMNFSTQEDCYISIENYELMQFTGLKDKNGKEIYEGDIYLTNVDIKYGLKPNIVEYKRCGYYLENEDCIEVIGNIYENKDLLAQKEDRKDGNELTSLLKVAKEDWKLKQKEDRKECLTCGHVKKSNPTPDGDEICPYCGGDCLDYEPKELDWRDRLISLFIGMRLSIKNKLEIDRFICDLLTQQRTELLEEILEENHCDLDGTYDYDGIAESVIKLCKNK